MLRGLQDLNQKDSSLFRELTDEEALLFVQSMMQDMSERVSPVDDEVLSSLEDNGPKEKAICLMTKVLRQNGFLIRRGVFHQLMGCIKKNAHLTTWFYSLAKYGKDNRRNVLSMDDFSKMSRYPTEKAFEILWQEQLIIREGKQINVLTLPETWDDIFGDRNAATVAN